MVYMKTLDGNSTDSCITEPSGTVLGIAYESRRCQVQQGAHVLTGVAPFGL